MSLYDAAKDALKIAQQADNVELVHKIIDVQTQALDMQEKQLKQNQEISDLKKQIEQMGRMKNYEFATDRNYLIDPDDPNRRFCPYCTRKHNLPVPLNGVYCAQCKGHYA